MANDHENEHLICNGKNHIFCLFLTGRKEGKKEDYRNLILKKNVRNWDKRQGGKCTTSRLINLSLKELVPNRNVFSLKHAANIPRGI